MMQVICSFNINQKNKIIMEKKEALELGKVVDSLEAFARLEYEQAFYGLDDDPRGYARAILNIGRYCDVEIAVRKNKFNADRNPDGISYSWFQEDLLSKEMEFWGLDDFLKDLDKAISNGKTDTKPS
jgi:hypothetical protein